MNKRWHARNLAIILLAVCGCVAWLAYSPMTFVAATGIALVVYVIAVGYAIYVGGAKPERSE